MSGTKYVYPAEPKPVRKFKWPDYVIYEGREVRCATKYPHFAQYMLPGAYMNKKLTLTKDAWLRHLDKHGYSD